MIWAIVYLAGVSWLLWRGPHAPTVKALPRYQRAAVITVAAIWPLWAVMAIISSLVAKAGK